MQYYVFSCILLFITTFLVIVVKSEENDPKIKTPLGELQGKYLKSRDGKIYYAFLGIPYAQPPTRFESPKPVKSWKGVKNANEFGSQCSQAGLGGMQPEQSGSEDCLFLNVYTPDVYGHFPVMVYIHGGAFMIGGADTYGGTYYMDEEVVLVTLNYRLGALGFLSTGDGVISGNFGLKDQNMALRWVQENIKSFGGDKDKVTILGESAGASSVSYHILSPMSKGLFHRAISQSGSALIPSVLVINPKEVASELAKKIGCPTDDSKDMAECLKGKSEAEILEGQSSLTKWHMDPIAPFAPTKELASSADAFLTECPHKILNEGRFNKVPWLVTIAKDEGQLLHASAVIRYNTLRTELNEQWEKLAPLTFQYDNIGLSEEIKESISSEIKNFYFDGKPIEVSSQQKLSDLYSDRWFVHGIQKAALLHAKHSPVYAGIFGFRGSPSTLMWFGLPVNEEIVTHGDDIKFHFDWSAMAKKDRPQEAKDAQEKASKMLVKLWVQFASGSSSEFKLDGVTWPKVSNEEIESRRLNWFMLDESPKVLSGIFDERMKFWDDAMEKDIHERITTKDEL